MRVTPASAQATACKMVDELRHSVKREIWQALDLSMGHIGELLINFGDG